MFHHPHLSLHSQGKPFPLVPPELQDFDEGLNVADGVDFYLDDYTNNDEVEAGRLDEELLPQRKMSAFVPGIASLANSHPRMHNIDRIYENSRRDYNGMVAPFQPGAGSFTPHHTMEYETTKGVREGMELLMDYGTKFHSKMSAKLKGLRKRHEGRGLDGSSARARQGFVEGIDKKWDIVDKREQLNCPEELPTEKGKRDRIAVGMAVDSSELKGEKKPYSEYRKNDYHPYADYDEDDDDEGSGLPPKGPMGADDITQSLPWLNDNGVCLSSGKLRIDGSSIPFAGRGVFATSHIKKGEVILPTPLLAIRREDLKIYHADPDQKSHRNVVDKTRVIGQELLLNYAFGHPDSPMVLVPNAPLANFINHGGPFVSERPKSKGANVQIRWPEADSKTAKLFAWAYERAMDEEYIGSGAHEANAWLKHHPIEVMERSGRLAFEYVALRDIHNGEEILIDYGSLWEQAWRDFARTTPYARAGYFRHDIGVPPGFYPDNWLNVSDRYEIAEISDLENKPLKVGEVLPMTWVHNGKPVSSKYAYVVGLQKGFSDAFLEYSEGKGIIELYKKLLTEQDGFHLPSDGFKVYSPATLLNGTASGVDKKLEFFAHRYHSDQWNFNVSQRNVGDGNSSEVHLEATHLKFRFPFFCVSDAFRSCMG